MTSGGESETSEGAATVATAVVMADTVVTVVFERPVGVPIWA
jgi:hypothetical protein